MAQTYTQRLDAVPVRSDGRSYADIAREHPGMDFTWIGQHTRAVLDPRGPEVPIVLLMRGWLKYADAHRDRYEDGIGTDYVLGPEWAAIGRAIRGLLNGETGRLDCGTLDALICDTLRAEGYGEDL